MKAENRSYHVGMTKFADLTPEEFGNFYLTTKPPALKPQPDADIIIPNVTIPASVDWREKNVITPIKHQHQCGSCWAFATIAGLESLYAIVTGKLKSFSEQQLLDCTSSYGNQACNSGSIINSYKYIRDFGILSMNDYPYIAARNQCQYDVNKTVFNNTGWVILPTNDQVKLAAAVAQRPVVATISAEAHVFMYYKGGIIDETACGEEMNHGVVIIGYGTEGDKDYWIIKNSWGTRWGEGGYGRIAKTNSTTSSGACGIARMPLYPIADIPTSNPL